jgi:glycosyltransferase involved in cell wall biosynthesis
MLKISIITVCYNSAATIQDTINSVARQSYINKEHIIVDGASKDATMEMVRTSPSVSLYVSETDSGIFDAMNKGIKLVSGDVIGMLNADDFYIDNAVLSDVAKVFEDEGVDACFADLFYVSQNDTDKVVRYWKSKEYKPGLFKKGWMPAHPTFFVRKRIYEKLGAFDLNYKFAADFELLLRFIEKNKINTVYLPRVILKMRLGGASNKTLKNIITQNKEIIQILHDHYKNISLFRLWISKIKSRTLQFIFRP